MKKIAVLLMFATVTTCLCKDYETVVKEIRTSFDNNTYRELYKRYWKEYQAKPTALRAFAFGAIRWQWLELMARGLKERPDATNSNEPERKALLYAIRHEQKSGYPLATYAWYIERFGEPGLPERPSKYVKTVDIKDANGKVIGQAPIYEDAKQYLALEKRQDQLIDKALSIDPNNAMALYAKYSRPFRESWSDVEAAKRASQLLPMAAGTFWEPVILGALTFAFKEGNQGVSSGLSQHVAGAREKSRNGAYGKVYKFLREG